MSSHVPQTKALTQMMDDLYYIKQIIRYLYSLRNVGLAVLLLWDKCMLDRNGWNGEEWKGRREGDQCVVFREWN